MVQLNPLQDRITNMKKYVIMFMIAMLSLIPSISYSQTPPASSSATATMSKEDIEKIRQQLDQLNKAMDGAAGSPSAATPSKSVGDVAAGSPSAATPGKSVGDVADKALGMFSGAIASLSSTMQKVAPEVWRIMIRQQYAKAISMMSFPLLTLAVITLYSIIIRKMWKTVEYDKKYEVPDERVFQIAMADIAPLIFGVIFGMILAYHFSEAIPLLLNPEYYAIKDLLKMILSPGTMN